MNYTCNVLEELT